ncbi:uncharacterized protein LOC122630372 isoform X4 [Vespula pensylvanica]|uniref:uncharacterized protein LOC122630372 isoform X4 n=1 Tax=Vespula pensylvanica TaxID=30213 RepID=UPI001CBA1ACF|nr:uncharacterized protein LOC122630372 isoform X4 [Vespula pensylvanica]
MSTADTVLSINVKMSPGPDHRQEPVAPDKSNTENSRTEIGNDSVTESTILGTTEALVVQNINLEATGTRIETISEPTNGQGTTPNSGSDNKQEEPTTLSTLNEGELRALLDEAITYKCPKDREGKSNLFKELLQEAEADETEEGRRVVTNSRCLPGSTRRRHKRDSVSERLTHGGSLQNLAQPIASEFDSSFAYLTSGSSHTYGSGKKKNKKYTGPSVSAREREGGSLPSNVNASHSLASLANLDLIFDNKVGAISERNVGSTISGVQQRPHPLDTEDEGIEMKIIEPRRQFIARATVDIAQTPVDTTIKFPICEHNGKQDKSKISVSAEVTGALPFQTYNSAKCVIGGSGNNTNNSQGKGISSLCSMMPASWQIQNNAIELPRCTTQYAIMKDATSSGEKKSLDENGNAVQSYNAERKKRGKKHTQEPNVIVYNAESVVGHRNEDDIDSLLNFIESKESKGKKNKTGNPVRVKSSSGTKPRTREKDSKREQLSAKLQKSNSLEEISKTKLEDLTTEKSISSSGTSSISSQHSTINVALRRAKQRSTGDAAVDCRGDRRSWGTEEGQSIYCNDTGDDYTSRRNSNKKINPEPETEPDFLIVTKKKKTKKQRRSSSGSRAQNLSTAGSYLQNTRGFSNEYRAPLSPELRRKSASSMPPSDKSDSSDLDSVHSLPVTSNTSKHNLSKTATSSGGTPQASYADIARMATMNMSHNSVLNMPVMVPSMLNTASWPRVPPKTPSEPDKLPQDYYPSLDELQHSDRKPKQHGFAHSNHMHNVGLTFEKPPSPTLSKIKNSSDQKKAEAQEEAINKNMQVFKYVQDIEKMQRSLTQQEPKHMNLINCNPHSNETPNAVQPKLNNTAGCNPFDSENNNPNYANNNKDVTNVKVNNPRSRRSYSQSNQNIQNQQEELHYRKTGYQDENVKKIHNADSSVVYCETKVNVIGSIVDDNEAQKLKGSNNPKSTHEIQSADVDSVKTHMKMDKMIKTVKEQSGKSGIVLSYNTKHDNQDDNGNKKTKSLMSTATENEQPQKSIETQGSTKKNNTSSRPAVILLDETSDFMKGSDLPTELTFGFEINEQLLLSEDSVETPPANPTFPSLVQPLLNKPPPNFDRAPALYDKHVRYDKFPPNFHMQSPNAHVAQQPVHSVMVPSLTYIGYPTRFPPPMFSPPPPPPPPVIIEKYNHQPKEDFSMLYVAPEEDVNIQNYNHDKIVSFVGLAWDAVMRETAETGRIQYYSGQ